MQIGASCNRILLMLNYTVFNANGSPERQMKFDKATEKLILRQLDQAAKKHGLAVMRHAINKWAAVQRDKASITKEQRELQKRLAELNKRLDQ